MNHSAEVEVASRRLILETGRVANQADGAVVVRYGDTVVLVTVCRSEKRFEGDFLPLIVDYREKTYAAGRIPGGFFKREGRPKDKEILTARLVDRPIRPLIPRGLGHELQIVAIVLSSDQENDSDVLAVIGASAVLSLSSIPFAGPLGAVRIGRVAGDLVLNPTFSQLPDSDLNLVAIGKAGKVLTLQGSAKGVTEEDVLKAIQTGYGAVQKTIQVQEELVSRCGKQKTEVAPPELPSGLEDELRAQVGPEIEKLMSVTVREERREGLTRLLDETVERLEERYPESEGLIGGLFQDVQKEYVRRKILEQRLRLDERSPEDIRPVSCEVGLLPRAHGSALFTRGGTQSLCATTLGTTLDEQKVEDLEGESYKSFMLHYNFPPFSVGEVKPLRAPARREVGHGLLAERALESVIPSEEMFPYTIRIVSDILESNGSSSMATVCGGSLSLMDAGVPIKAPVAGIALGLVTGEDKEVILADIAGEEDHFGDMDFKVAGTRSGITAIQLDTKIEGIELRTLEEALALAREGRHEVLDVMENTLPKPRADLSVYAPRLWVINIRKDKIGDVIGTGGRVIRGIIDETGAKVEIDDDGKVTISALDKESGERALQLIEKIVEEVEIGKTYLGRVTRVTNFGAFVEVLPGKEGLVHISQIAPFRVSRVEDFLKVGDEVMVKVIGIDEQGRINLSHKAVTGAGSRGAKREGRRGQGR